MSFTAIIGVLIIFVLGLINVFSPSTGWYLSIGWKLKDSEPSDLALLMQRLGGFFALAVVVVLFVIALRT